MLVVLTDASQTDDVGVFCSPLSNEYLLAARHFNLTRDQLTTLAESVVDMIFAGEDEKTRLRKSYDLFRWR
jgi:adenosine deaminase